MAKNYKYVPEYKRYDTVLATLAQAHNMIVGCHDQLLELGVDQNTLDTHMVCTTTGTPYACRSPLGMERLASQKK